MTSRQSASDARLPNRRDALLWGGGAAAAAGLAAVGVKWSRPAAVFIARNQRYDADLATVIRDGLAACGVGESLVRGRQVLLKPNLVEPSRTAPHMTTHPAVVIAAAEVFRNWGAQVAVGEAPGHIRDTRFALLESGLGDALHDAGIRFADLNYEESAWRPNAGRRSRLKGIFLPRSVVEADLVVSMPKLKTHHWVGMTASMKNLYGILPGIKYGWPKNVLHHNGIPQTVVDIACTAQATVAIVDAIECMEGDGPILGSAKPMGLLMVGKELASVDATAARIMGLEPEKISYLSIAPRRLGTLREASIVERGERWQSVASRFKLVDQPHLLQLRAPPSAALDS